LKVLYISYDGMTDPLGQSQVIPYLQGLSLKGHEIFLISCEKKPADSKEHQEINLILKGYNIKWFPLKYTSRPAILSTIFDLVKIKHLAVKVIKEHAVEIIHCRSYIAALAGISMKKKYGVKFIFDMRGFYADERIDGEIWNLNNPIYKSVYNYFKKKEKEFLINADYTISLTEQAKKIILNWNLTSKPLQIEVIPCCADLEVFDKNKVNEETQTCWKAKLNIGESDFILSYLGSLGTWYMPNEMLDFFKVLLKKHDNAKFLFITPDKPADIFEMAIRKGIPSKHIIVLKATRNEVPTLLALSQVSIFFIKPVFSKKASSPTKMGEIMGMGIPVICNSNVGDVDAIVESSKGGNTVNTFEESSYEKSVDAIPELLQIDPNEIRIGAEKFYSLKLGVEKYDAVYRSLIKG